MCRKWVNSVESTTISIIVNFIRKHEMSTGQKWPGTGRLFEPVKCRYPNLAAEIAAHGYFLWCPANHANVSKKIMAAVLEDGETLTFNEVMGLARLFEIADLEYLISPELKTVTVEDDDTQRVVTYAEYRKQRRDKEDAERPQRKTRTRRRC